MSRLPATNMLDGTLRVVTTDGNGRILIKTNGGYFEFRKGRPLAPVKGSTDGEAVDAWRRYMKAGR